MGVTETQAIRMALSWGGTAGLWVTLLSSDCLGNGCILGWNFSDFA